MQISPQYRTLEPPLRIGQWTVEPDLNQVSAAGRTLKLEAKALAVLAYLAQRPGQVVSREELLAAVWRGWNPSR